MIKLIEQIIAALAAFFTFIDREKDRQSGRLEATSAAAAELEKRSVDAENIRAGDNVGDEFLLPPEQRGS